MPVISSYQDFFRFLVRMTETESDPWSLYEEYYLEPHQAFLMAWWEQSMGKPMGVWQARVMEVRPEHYGGIRAMIDESGLEGAVAEALVRSQKVLPLEPEPAVHLMIGFFSPDGFVVQVGEEWQIGLGLERLGEAKRAPLLVAHEYAHWYRRNRSLPAPHTLGERLIEEGLATHLSTLAYPERSLAQHLFISEHRLNTLEDYFDSLIELAHDNLDTTTAADIQRFLYLHTPGPELPPRPGGYIGYKLVLDYLADNPQEPEMLFTRPAGEFIDFFKHSAERV